MSAEKAIVKYIGENQFEASHPRTPIKGNARMMRLPMKILIPTDFKLFLTVLSS